MPDSPPTSVYITVDTEWSIGGAWSDPARHPLPSEKRIFCRTPRGDFGLTHLVSQLQRFGFRATFFCEMFAASVFGDGEVAAVTDYLLSQHQDVQLHAHPTFLYYGEYLSSGCDPAVRQANRALSDNLSSYQAEGQRRLLSDAHGIFRRITGKRPVAFRAGSYAADLTSLAVLAELGIPIDSSYNPCYPHSFSGDTAAANQLRSVHGVWELPVSVATTRFPDHGPFKTLEISALSFAEMRTALEQASAAGLQHLVLIFHSFSGVKPSDIFYSNLRPNRIVLGRFRRLLEFLAANPRRFRVSTVGEALPSLEAWQPTPAFIPDLGPFRPAFRKAVQAVNHLYWT